MGCFYTGFDYKNRKNGYFKIGETSKTTPTQRIRQIQRTDCFQCLGYIQMIDETYAERLYVESTVRLYLSKMPGLTHIQNDHFIYRIISKEEKYSQAEAIAKLALNCAKNACKEKDIRFKDGTKKISRRQKNLLDIQINT